LLNFLPQLATSLVTTWPGKHSPAPLCTSPGQQASATRLAAWFKAASLPQFPSVTHHPPTSPVSSRRPQCTAQLRMARAQFMCSILSLISSVISLCLSFFLFLSFFLSLSLSLSLSLLVMLGSDAHELQQLRSRGSTLVHSTADPLPITPLSLTLTLSHPSLPHSHIPHSLILSFTLTLLTPSLILSPLLPHSHHPFSHILSHPILSHPPITHTPFSHIL
jgi:hypothetical protein